MASDSSRAKASVHLLLAFLLLVSLGIRLGWALSRPVDEPSIDALPDQREYLSIAQNLLLGKGFEFYDKRFSQTVRAFRTPGYPLFLAACHANVRTARIVQAVIDTSTIAAVFLLACAVSGYRGEQRPTTGLIAAAIVAFNPYLVFFSGLLLSETLVTAVLAWAMVLLTWRRSDDHRRRSNIFWLGGLLLLALSVLARPSVLALPVLLGILSAFVNRHDPSAYQVVRLREEMRRPDASPLLIGASAILLVLLSLFPWAWRNRAVLGHWIWLDTNSGFTLYDAYNPGATGASDQTFVNREPDLQKLGEVDRSEYLARKAKEYICKHPGRVIPLIVAKLSRTWSPIPLSSEYGKPGLRVIALAYSLPFDILVLAGLIWGNLPRSTKVFLLAPAIYLSVVHALTVGSLRYRIPAEPPLAIIAAAALGVRCGPGKSWRRIEPVG